MDVAKKKSAEYKKAVKLVAKALIYIIITHLSMNCGLQKTFSKIWPSRQKLEALILSSTLYSLG